MKNRRTYVYVGLAATAAGLVFWHALRTPTNPANRSYPDQSQHRVAEGGSDASMPLDTRQKTIENTNFASPPRSAPESSAAPWNDLSRRKAKFDEIYLGVEAKYGRFFERLSGRSAEDIERVKLEITRQNLNKLVAVMASSTDPGSVDLAQLILEGQKRLVEILSPKEYERLRTFEEAESHRNDIRDVSNMLSARGISLNAADEEILLNAYVEANRLANQRTRDQSPPSGQNQLDSEFIRILDSKFPQEVTDAVLVALGEKEKPGS